MEAFHLVGGTALTLYLGHRTSMDIDLFTTESSDARLHLERSMKKWNEITK